ncbi:hypothetical protein FDECE_6212 [Fusarium decemcellulare]|nr:hypothetical protein FDECE_6212 [Fusarium decemcellulare]
MSAPQSEAFKTAIEDSKKLTSKPGNEELLDLYALFKVGKLSLPFSFCIIGLLTFRSPQQGKAKYNAWKKVADEGISADAAQERYVKLVEELKVKYGYDAAKVPEAVGSS